MKKVGIYSGSFDPIHEGHMAFARAAIKNCGLEKVFLLVEPRPRRKQGVRALTHRINMVNIAVKHEPKLGSINLEQARFTVIDTLPMLQARFKGAELYLLMGDDMLAHLSDWPHVEELTNNVSFVIGARKYSASEVKKRVEFIKRVRELHVRYMVLETGTTYSTLSSRGIRQAIKKGKGTSGLMPEVAAYIREQGLYTMTDSSSRS